jgi:XTP/dITP diphosphohydrolase
MIPKWATGRSISFENGLLIKILMNELIIATQNPGKLREFRDLLAGLAADTAVSLVSPAERGIDLEVEETGTTYAENASLKAVALAQASDLVALGDDSGLEVAALNGAPGLYSARYAGLGATDADRRRKLLHELRQVPAPRPARFVCVIAVAQPGGAVRLFEGDCLGEVALAESGSGGFGFDPLFYLPERGVTMAALSEAVKNTLSHRARAAQAAMPYLLELFRK